MADVWDDAKPALNAIAPTIASAFGGPLEGAAIGFLCKALGLDQAASAPVVAHLVTGATPDQQIALKQADDGFMAWMAELKISRAVVASDVESARAMSVARKDWVAPLIAILVVIGFFGLLLLMAFVPIPASSQTTLNLMLGTLSAAFGAVMGFYFGSSAGSAAKDKMLFASSPSK